MSRPLTAVAALNDKSVTEKIQLGEGIVQALADNPTVFEKPSPTAIKIGEVTQELHDANEEAATGLTAGKQRLKKAIKEFDACISQYQTYVNLIAQGDGEIIEQSGLQVSREVQKSGPMPAPGGLDTDTSISRQLMASVTPVERAKAYVWVYFVGDVPPVEDRDWHLACGTSAAKMTLTGLTSKTTVWVRCAAIGPKGQGAWSKAVSDNVR